ncbi:DUF4142 domain-containing protein [Olivibacter sp. XZL3]|uniref:DUF4142 domain-containing protein n=1 Tax=Olivibacter sp. XZL3 TaxID=1735116 RepID=UPI001065071D|nr:DUF4142 domain-containing protein [Olivibacter sp. XZL3]
MTTKAVKSVYFLLIVGLFLAGCNAGNRGDQTVDSIEKMNDSMGNKSDSVITSAPALSDTSFVNQAADAGLTEVAVGKLAQEKGVNQAIRDFGKRMVADHSKANEELTTIANRKNWTLPSSPSKAHADHIAMLQTKEGADFDKAFADMMVKDHDKVVKLFENASASLTDTDLKAFAAKTLLILEEHLTLAKNLPK